MINLSRKQKLALGIVVAVGVTTPVLAVHSWSNYHWKRTTAELTVPVGDNVSAAWDIYLTNAVADWNQSTVINSPKVAGSTNPKNCRAVAGTIQACNSTYGNNGWLGLASISLSGGHIIQGTTKLNDTYYNTAQYNTPEWRAAVTCRKSAMTMASAIRTRIPALTSPTAAWITPISRPGTGARTRTIISS